jgi:AhpD family alkylhydroperoxidase
MLMARISYVDPDTATGKQKELLDGVQAKLGTTPNMMKAMAGSAVLEGYLGLAGALAGGSFGPSVAERLALGVAESNECSYCLSAHSYLAENVAKIESGDIDAARRYDSSDPNADAALKFASVVVATRGDVPAEAFETARDAGLSDAELAEIVGHVALNVLTNYFNKAFEVDVDFPLVEPQGEALAA